MKTTLAGLACILIFTAPAAQAEIAVAAIDGKQLHPGDAGPTPDAIAVLNIAGGTIKMLGQVAAPASMIGPPAAVAVARDSSYALVTACQKLVDGKLAPDDLVSVVDLSSPAHPKVIQTAHAGSGASGVSISPNGKLALVASTGEDAISIFTIAGKTLTPAGKVAIAAKSIATDVVFTPDGKSALVVGRGNSQLAVLSVDGATVKNSGRSFSTGRSPYGAAVTPDSKYVINTNLDGINPPPGTRPPVPAIGTIGMADIKTGKTVASVKMGITPEHVVMSGDGKYVAVVVANGAPNDASDPRWKTAFGLLEVLAVGNGTLTPLARADTGHWCQGATIAADDKTFVLECAADRDFEVYHLKGNSLVRDKAATIPVVSRPGAIATAISR